MTFNDRGGEGVLLGEKLRSKLRRNSLNKTR